MSNGLSSCLHKKNRTNHITVKQTFTESVTVLSLLFVLHFIFVPICSILFNSLFNFSSLTEIPKRSMHFLYFSHTGSRPTFSLRLSLLLFCEQHAGLNKNLPVYANDTSDVTIQFT